MANKSYKNFLQGIGVIPKSSTGSSKLGEIEVLNTTNKLHFYNSVTHGSDPIVQENVPATISNKTLTAPVINNATADIITGITGAQLLIQSASNENLSLQAQGTGKVTLESLTVDSSNISASTDIVINQTGSSKTYFQVTGTNVARVDADGIAFLAQDKVKLYDSDNSNFIGINSPSAVPSDYTITLPPSSPTANTALVYDGTAYKWGAAGGADSAGANDDILATAFRARILDSFDDAPSAPPTGASTINSLTTTATHVPANQLYAIQYDGTQTLTGGGTTYSLGASPSFTLAVGDVLVAGGEVRKITALGTPNAWVLFTIESAFVGSPSGPCVVSQTVSSKELYGSVFDGDSISDAFSNASFSEYLIDYQDSTTAIYQTGTSPLVGYSVSQDNSTWSNPVDRPQYQTDEIQSGTFASPGTALYVRLFANANTLASSGTINLLEYRAYMQKSPIVASGTLNQAYARLDGSITPQFCTTSVVSGKTRVTLSWQYSTGVNSTSTYGAIDVYINGQFVPRQVGTYLPSGAFYKEISSTVIELDTDYSTTPYAIQIIQRQPMGNYTSSTGSSSSVVGSGLKNYLTTYKGNAGNGDFETGDTTGWSLFNTTLTSLIPTGSITAGAASISTFQATATTPLAALYSLSVGSSGALAAGQGFISSPFTIDLEDQAKVLSFNFSYQAVSGTMNFSGTSANTWAVYLHDGTNWIQPAGVYNLVQSSGVGLATGTFQTTSSSTSYRIALICINATGGAVSMKFDDFFVGPQISVTAPAMSDWASNTTIAPNNMGTLTNAVYRTRRIGDTLEVMGTFTSGTVSSTAGNFASISLPTGLSIDSSKLPSNAGGTVVGSYFTGNTGTNFNIWYSGASTSSSNGLVLFYDGSDTSKVYASVFQASNTLSKSVANVIINSNTTQTFSFRVPIAGWSSNTVSSADTDTRVVAAKYSGSVSATASTAAPVQWNTLQYDTHGAVTTGSGWKFTAPVSGIYRVNCTLNSTSGAQALAVYKNGSITPTIIGDVNTTQNLSGSGTIYLLSGEYIDIRPTTSSFTVSANANFSISIERLSGPAVVQASELVTAQAATNTGTYSNGNTVLFGTENWDSHGAYEPTTGIFTAPISGTYEVGVFLRSANFTPSAGNFYGVNICKNGTTTTYQVGGITANAAVSQTILIGGSSQIKLNAGDTARITVSLSAGTLTLLNDAVNNVLNIKRIGN